MSEPKLQNLSPVWLVDDVAEACAYYEEKLGFTTDFIMGEPALYGSVSRDGVTISFNKPQNAGVRNQVAPLGPVADFADAYVAVSDVRAWYDRLRATEGVTLEDELKRYEYGMVDFVAIDLNGYKLCFGQAADEVTGADELPEGIR